MYNIKRKHFLFRQSNQKVWSFYYDDKLGLCYNTLNKRNTWQEPVSLQKNIHPSFSVDMDESDVFHIIFQDKKGSIFYTRINDSEILTKPLLISKNPLDSEKHLHIISEYKKVHFFYVLNHNNGNILSYQTYINDQVSSPKVIDYIHENDNPYSAILDDLSNIFLFYKSTDGKNLHLGYKKLTDSPKNWSDFTSITSQTNNCEYAKLLKDNKNIIHACYIRKNNNQYEILYQQKVPEKNIWSNETVLAYSTTPFLNTSILSINDEIIVFWVKDENIIFTFSEDAGANWSKPAKYSFTCGRQLFCMSYKSNLASEKSKIFCQENAGCFINGFKLAFYTDLTTTSAGNLSADELKTLIVEGINLLKLSVEDLKESEEKNKEDISLISNSFSAFEKEIIKLNLRINLLENQLKKQ